MFQFRQIGFAASADLSAIRAALRAVLVPGFELPEDEDELRLPRAAVIGRALAQVRGRAREKEMPIERAVPTA